MQLVYSVVGECAISDRTPTTRAHTQSPPHCRCGAGRWGPEGWGAGSAGSAPPRGPCSGRVPRPPLALAVRGGGAAVGSGWGGHNRQTYLRQGNTGLRENKYSFSSCIVHTVHTIEYIQGCFLTVGGPTHSFLSGPPLVWFGLDLGGPFRQMGPDAIAYALNQL